MQKKKKSIVVAVSEGVKLPDGRYVCELSDNVADVDSFGHRKLTGTARYLANECAKALNTKTRAIELSTLQRCCGHLTSRIDITEAYQVGGAAVSQKHAGFAVNLGGATAKDVLSLLEQVSDKVYDFSGIRLEPEIRLWKP